MKYLTVDGMLSGTGIRNTIEGDYLNLEQLRLSKQLINKISTWLDLYEDAHFMQYQDKQQITSLDKEGLLICSMLKKELPESKVEYFSNAKMTSQVIK